MEKEVLVGNSNDYIFNIAVAPALKRDGTFDWHTEEDSMVKAKTTCDNIVFFVPVDNGAYKRITISAIDIQLVAEKIKAIESRPAKPFFLD